MRSWLYEITQRHKRLREATGVMKFPLLMNNYNMRTRADF
jgi:hypothetical protein